MEHLDHAFDHVHLRVANADKSFRFYSAVLGALGMQLTRKEDDFWCGEFYASPADDYVSRIHLAFKAQDEESVRRFYAAGLAGGGSSNGEPGIRGYHPGYYAAFLLDPDGNNIEAVYHGRARQTQ